MTRHLLLAPALAAAIFAAEPAANPADPAHLAAAASNAFAPGLHRALSAKGGNLVFSPLSVTTALNMTAAGAKGATLREFESVFHHPADVHAAGEKLLAKVRAAATKEVDVRIANALWGPFEYEKAFVDLNRERYGAPVNNIKLVGAEPAINKWAEDATAGRIKDLLPPKTFDADSRLVLTNAVYFKGPWKTPFEKRATKNEPFRAPGGKADVPMMRQVTAMRHARIGDATAVELPYKGDALSMVVVVPDADDGLGKVEKALDLAALNAAIDKAAPRRVDLRLPKFKISGDAVELKEPLQALGLTRAFRRGSADFTGIMPSGGLYVHSVRHKAFIDVNEAGTEAAAVTAVHMKGKSRQPDPVAVTADRPFLFAIRHAETGAVVFMGRVEKP